MIVFTYAFNIQKLMTAYWLKHVAETELSFVFRQNTVLAACNLSVQRNTQHDSAEQEWC
jgi:hypothetical protein